jgi:hypothetical protein
LECALGASTINYAKVKAATILLIIAREEGLRELNIYGD